jgi:eukaryotic-like serine/threonine-protein kinase
MAIRLGDHLGPYEVLAAIGAGEVYRARDSKLGRDVEARELGSSSAATLGFGELTN